MPKRALLLILPLLVSCSQLTHVVWPATLKCAGLVTGSIVTEIDKIVTAGTDSMSSDLEGLAVTDGASIVACVLQQLLASYTAPVEPLLRAELRTATPDVAGQNYDQSISTVDPRAARVRTFLAAHNVPVSR